MINYISSRKKSIRQWLLSTNAFVLDEVLLEIEQRTENSNIAFEKLGYNCLLRIVVSNTSSFSGQSIHVRQGSS